MAKILMVHDTSRMSGPGNSLLKLYKYLKIDHEIIVAVPDQGEYTQLLDKHDIPWLRLQYCSCFKTIPAFLRTVWRNNFDLVYGNNFSTPALEALIAAKLLRKPFIWHIREKFAPTAKRPWLIRCMKFSNAIIAVSQASARAIKYHIPGQVVNVVYNGVEFGESAIARDVAKRKVYADLEISSDDILVVGIGHICPRKNQQQAVEAAAKVIQTHPHVKFCFLGLLDHTPDYTISLKEQISRLGINRNIYLPGFRDDISTYLRGADIFLHTAIKDPHPRSLLEGMAAELPVVAYDLDGVSETVVHGKTGFLVQINDIDMLSGRIKELATDSGLRLKMGKAGNQRVRENFTAEHTAHRVKFVIQEVLHAKKLS